MQDETGKEASQDRLSECALPDTAPVEDGQQQVDIHKPKPVKNWREFVREIAIVVIGVLIALGAEYLIEQRHWREETEIAEGAFREELLKVGGVAYERLIIQPCLQGRIRDLSNDLNETAGPWKASPMATRSSMYRNVMPVVYRAPSRLLLTDGWKSAIANGTLNHLPSERVRALSTLYDQVDQFAALQREESKSAASLTPLAFDRILDASSRTQMLASLADVDRINSLMALNGSQMLESLRALNFRFNDELVESGRREAISIQRAARGSCVADLPLDLG